MLFPSFGWFAKQSRWFDEKHGEHYDESYCLL
jgi:hypothetical protein